MKNNVVSVLLVLWLTVVAIDALPRMNLFHHKLKKAVDPALDRLGLWQESWKLFAPEVDKINTRVSAVVSFEDGTQSLWISPNWGEVPWWEKFLRFREMEFFDSIRMDSNAGAWPGFAQYLKNTVKHPSLTGPSVRGTGIILNRQWTLIRLPGEPIQTEEVTFYHEE